jgi:hypothetical protein
MKKLLTSALALTCFSLAATAQISLQDPQYWRPYDQRGINMFETPKVDTVGFDGIKVRLGGGFAQQFQGLRHSNTAQPRFDAQDRNLNQLFAIGNGFNLATANLNLDVQLADGIRMNLITYLSSRNHPEAWVKGGFIQVDKLTFLNSNVVDRIMDKVTVRVGHMEINYGDAHFRRTDNAHALQNPFVGNYIMDAFTTEIGGEVYFQHNGFLAMGSVTGGEIQGGIAHNPNRRPAFIGKVGYDKQLMDDLRVRLTGSVYHTESSVRNTLYGGDRAGSRYSMVMEPAFVASGANVTPSTHFTSGRFNPGITNKVTALVLNPFVKFYGLEVFGNLEQVRGAALNETAERTWNQVGIDGVYRIGKTENFYVAGRYNKVSGKLMGSGADVSIDRVQVGGGWFVTKNILAKIEYVNQRYQDFPGMDIRNGGRFSGLMLEGAVSF